MKYRKGDTLIHYIDGVDFSDEKRYLIIEINETRVELSDKGRFCYVERKSLDIGLELNNRRFEIVPCIPLTHLPEDLFNV